MLLLGKTTHGFMTTTTTTTTPVSSLRVTTKTTRRRNNNHKNMRLLHRHGIFAMQQTSTAFVNDDEEETNNNIDSRSSPSSSSSSQFLLEELLTRFQGDFDNYHQVCSDRTNGLLPREGGGHEHFHVTLIPLPIMDILPKEQQDSQKIVLFPHLQEEEETNHDDDDTSTSLSSNKDKNCGAVVAAYYFDGMPNRIFRLRMYTFYCDKECHSKGDMVKMKLFTLDPVLEGKLRAQSSYSIDGERWIDLIEQHYLSSQEEEVSKTDDDNPTTTLFEEDDDKSSSSSPLSSSFHEMKRCDILWRKQPDPIRHAYLNEYTTTTTSTRRRATTKKDDNNNDSSPEEEEESLLAINAIMMYDHDDGGVLLESQMMPGSYIRVQDELSLWDNELWINDRGHDANDDTKMVYGNWNGVPYQMTRVSKLEEEGSSSSSSSSRKKLLKRQIVDPSLRWTLGEQYRTPKEYESKMSIIGGISTRMNNNQKK